MELNNYEGKMRIRFAMDYWQLVSVVIFIIFQLELRVKLDKLGKLKVIYFKYRNIQIT
jgi:hypothetical protein